MIDKLRNYILFKYIEQAIIRYKYDDISGISAQITYYLILAFFPFLLFLINLLSFTPLSSEILINNFDRFLPTETSILIENVLLETLESRSGTLLIVGILASLWSASRGLNAIIKGLNRAFDVEENRNFITLISLTLISTIGLTIIIILSFFMLVLGGVIENFIFDLLGESSLITVVWKLIRYIIPAFIMFIIFSLLYKYTPNIKLNLKNIIIGALFATIGCNITSLLFSFYVNNFNNYAMVYGSLGGIIGLIFWLYISTFIIILGGELISIHKYIQNN
ncbi:YihY family inner membrane protein [Alkalibaculum sp. M08DMB]|uniref:YihY family inner membrane protein n=1 Tax=Alkalibaculum sporogenes TaxID=2655001 RepID=A0A6A7KB88_9FIRM|nr:YihY/virulence factor BrkB family protein [Alkalibaculum sporogenes]MPW26656.1 YihY family inner membrane protein [Alkalibaculum sporogenes]